MKKKSVWRVIVRTFGKTLGILFIMIGVGVASFYLTTLFYTMTNREERSTTYEHVIDVDTGADSANLIFSVNEEKKVAAVVLELYNGDTNNLDYVTIPAASAVQMSSKLYLSMLEKSKEVPQIARISKINEYFSGDVAYEYAIMMLEEAMDVEIGYFTAIPSKTFNTYFENVGKSDAPKYAPSAAVSAKIGGTDEDSISDFMDSTWGDLISDITLSQKQRYAKGLAKVKKDFIHVWRVECDAVEGKATTYYIDKTAAKKLINRLLDNEAYTTKQGGKSSTSSSSSSQKSSKGKKIQVTNASNITGLAASYKEKFEADGFTVQGTGNYSGELQTSTKILVKKKGLGKDLQSYFSDATVEVTSDALTEDADIEVILGTDSKLSE